MVLQFILQENLLTENQKWEVKKHLMKTDFIENSRHYSK